MTPTQLARAADVTPGAINLLENGKTGMPSFDTGLLLARALGVSPYYLAFGDDPRASRDLLGEIDDLRARIEALEQRK